MRHISLLLLLGCLALSAAGQHVDAAAADKQQQKTKWGRPGRPSVVPVFKVSAFKDVTAYVLSKVQQDLKGVLDVQLKWVGNADEAHSDLRTWTADLACMSYDDTLSMSQQEAYRDIVAAWPMHGSMMSLCGTIDVAKGLSYVGIDTDTGYARMLRQELQKTLSSADYQAVQWVYAGATNLRYEKLVAQAINATLLNPPFTTFVRSAVPCDPFYTHTGPIQGSVGNVHQSALLDPYRSALIRRFFDCYKRATLDMRDDKAGAVAGLSDFYNVTSDVAEDIYSRLWGVDGLSTSFCFEPTRLSTSEAIFAQDTGLNVPRLRWWVRNWGCMRGHGRD